VVFITIKLAFIQLTHLKLI